MTIYNNTRFKTASNKKYYFSVDLDEDDLLVLRELCINPSASNREIGRILGHDHKWVGKRKDKLEIALKGWMQFGEVKDGNGTE